MNIIDFEDFVSCVIVEETTTTIKVSGSKMMKVRHELLHSGIACDFSPGAIDTFAYHYPQNVKVSHFEIEICPNKDFTHRLLHAHPINNEFKTLISPIWKKINK